MAFYTGSILVHRVDGRAPQDGVTTTWHVPSSVGESNCVYDSMTHDGGISNFTIIGGSYAVGAPKTVLVDVSYMGKYNETVSVRIAEGGNAATATEYTLGTTLVTVERGNRLNCDVYFGTDANRYPDAEYLTVPPSTTVYVRCIPHAGYSVSGWNTNPSTVATVNVGGFRNDGYFTAPSTDVYVYPTVGGGSQNVYSVYAETCEHGSVYVSQTLMHNSDPYYSNVSNCSVGSRVYVYCVPDSGYELVSWSARCQSYSNYTVVTNGTNLVSGGYLIVPNDNVIVSATFRQTGGSSTDDTYYLLIDTNGGTYSTQPSLPIVVTFGSTTNNVISCVLTKPNATYLGLYDDRGTQVYNAVGRAVLGTYWNRDVPSGDTRPRTVWAYNGEDHEIKLYAKFSGGDTSIPIPTAIGGLIYNGSGQLGVNNVDLSKMRVDGEYGAVDAGTYRAIFVLFGGYVWSDGTYTDKTVTWSISRAANPMEISPSSLSITNVTNQAGRTITASHAVGNVTYSSSDTSVATVNSSGVVTYVSPGTATISVTAAGDHNYLPSVLECQVSCTYTQDTIIKTKYDIPVITSFSYSEKDASSGTVQRTLEYYQRATLIWASGNVEHVTYTSGATESYTMTTGNGASINTTTGAVTWTANETTSDRTSNTISVSITLNNTPAVTATATAVQSADAETTITYGIPEVLSYTYDECAAGGGTKSPSVTYSQSRTQNWVSGKTTDLSALTSGGSLSFSADSLVSGLTKNNTSTFATDGNVKWENRGTILGNARDGHSALSVTVTMNGKMSEYKCTACRQAANLVTGIVPRASSGTTHVGYSGTISAGGGDLTPSKSGSATYTFSSGSTKVDSSGSPSFGGSSSYTRTYSEKTDVTNSFTVNASTGVVSAASRGTTVGDVRSVVVTADLVVRYTHPSAYGSGVVTSSTLSNDLTVNQDANALTGLSLTLSSDSVDFGQSVNGTTSATYTSGDSKNVTPTSITSNPTGYVTIS